MTLESALKVNNSIHAGAILPWREVMAARRVILYASKLIAIGMAWNYAAIEDYLAYSGGLGRRHGEKAIIEALARLEYLSPFAYKYCGQCRRVRDTMRDLVRTLVAIRQI